MLGVGWTEMLVIGIVALIVIGPKELPAMMGRIGKFAGTIRRMGQDFQRELNKTTNLDEIKNLRTSVTQPLKATADAIRKEFNATTSTGAVQPSGVIKPADPKAESVVDEIKAAAGMAPAAAPAMTPTKTVLPFTAAAAAAQAAAANAPPATSAAPPIKAKRAPKVKLPAETPVVAADLPAPVKSIAPARKTAARKSIESPAPVEAIAPAKKPAAAKTAPTETAAAKKPAAARKPATAKPAAPTPAAVETAPAKAAPLKKPAAKATASKAPATRKPAAKPAAGKA